MIPRAMLKRIWILLFCVAVGCASSNAKSAAPSAATLRQSEALTLPVGFHIKSESAFQTGPGQWILVSSISARKRDLRNTRYASRIDLSTFQPIDPWLGMESSPNPAAQEIFVEAMEAQRVRADAHAWTRRYVIQIGHSANPLSISPRVYNMMSIGDVDRQICTTGVRRTLVSLSESDMIYESEFSNCPKLGPDRIVLTRLMLGEADWLRGSQIACSCSYEVKGIGMTPAERAEAMRLILAPRLAPPSTKGPKLIINGAGNIDAVRWNL
jgi:hypothetical protein